MWLCQYYCMNAPHGWWEKVWWEQYKNATKCFEQILWATPSIMAAVGPLTSYPKNHPSKTNKTCRTLLEKQWQSHKLCFSMDPYIWICQSWLISSVEILDRVWKTCWEWWMIGTDGERESGKFVLSAQWWWWFLPNTNNMHIVIWFQVFLSNTNI